MGDDVFTFGQIRKLNTGGKESRCYYIRVYNRLTKTRTWKSTGTSDREDAEVVRLKYRAGMITMPTGEGKVINDAVRMILKTAPLAQPMMDADLEETERIPGSPGIYFFWKTVLNRDGAIIETKVAYVGQSKNLKERIRGHLLYRKRFDGCRGIRPATEGKMMAQGRRRYDHAVLLTDPKIEASDKISWIVLENDSLYQYEYFYIATLRPERNGEFNGEKAKRKSWREGSQPAGTGRRTTAQDRRTREGSRW